MPADDQPSASPAALLSYRAWQQEYGADPKVIGASFMLDGHPFTIVGITPPGFYGETLRSDPPQLWVPLQQEPLLMGTNSILKQTNAWLRVIGRLRPGAVADGLPSPLYRDHAAVAGNGFCGRRVEGVSPADQRPWRPSKLSRSCPQARAWVK